MFPASSLRRKLLLAFASTIVAGVPALAPAVPAAVTVLRVAPSVRRIVLNLHRLEIPQRWRRRNWIGDRGQGSCVHASLVHLLHWQGRHGLADWWQKHYADGETATGLATKLDAAGIPFGETRSGDEAFLEWAIRTRRGAAVVVQNGAHMVNLVGLDRRSALILDSNAPEQIQEITRSEFLREWKSSGGWAVTPVGVPTPPSPWIVR